MIDSKRLTTEWIEEKSNTFKYPDNLCILVQMA